MEDNNQYRETFNATIGETLGQAVRIIAGEPALVIPGTVILHHQRKAAAVRRQHEREGLMVPPVMIVSITSRCNLACAGCYMHGRGEKSAAEMSPAILSSAIDQAADLGVSVIVIAGGEPLVRQDEIFSLAEAHPRVLFPLFTNGLLIDEPMAGRIAQCRNIVPVISFEGLIMVTGNPGKRHQAYAESLGVEKYMNKPVRMERLIKEAETLLVGGGEKA